VDGVEGSLSGHASKGQTVHYSHLCDSLFTFAFVQTFSESNSVHRTSSRDTRCRYVESNRRCTLNASNLHFSCTRNQPQC